MCDCGSRIHVKTGKKDISGAREKCSWQEIMWEIKNTLRSSKEKKITLT